MVALSDKEFYLLSDYMYRYCGFNLKEKRHLIESRLNGLLTKLGLADFNSLYEVMLKDSSGKLVAAIVDNLSTNHTYFWREASHFEYLRDVILPDLRKSVKNKDLCIWSAGCSTGEEPYTLAMILADFFGIEKSTWDTRILATDISSRVLKKAQQAIFSKQEIESLPFNWAQKYFMPVGPNTFQVIDRIRNEIIFRRFNLLESNYPFKKKFHVIFCRNVMIYFDAKTKKELVDRFHGYSNSGGYLFIGQSEAINRDETAYKYVMPAVYRKG